MKFIDFDQNSKGTPFVLWSRVPLKFTLSRYFVKLSGFHKTSDMNTVLAIVYFFMYFDEMEGLDRFSIQNRRLEQSFEHCLIQNRRCES